MYDYIGYLGCNHFNMVGCTDRNTLHLLIVSDENTAPIFVVRNYGPCFSLTSVIFLETQTVSMLFLHKYDSMEALTADRPSMFAEITVSALTACSRHLLV